MVKKYTISPHIWGLYIYNINLPQKTWFIMGMFYQKQIYPREG